MTETTDRDRDLVESYFGSPYRVGRSHGALAEAMAQLVARSREAARQEAIEECAQICDAVGASYEREKYFSYAAACYLASRRIRAMLAPKPEERG